jgi:hypothetical protein
VLDYDPASVLALVIIPALSLFLENLLAIEGYNPPFHRAAPLIVEPLNPTADLILTIYINLFEN